MHEKKPKGIMFLKLEEASLLFVYLKQQNLKTYVYEKARNASIPQRCKIYFSHLELPENVLIYFILSRGKERHCL